ncbi:MAG: DUF4760 domain-containing protein [Anaerolineales bacterium]|jgi:hypothetical protein
MNDILSLSLAIIALVISIAIAVRQMRGSRKAETLPALIEMLGEYRSYKSVNHRKYIAAQLRQECDPNETGYSKLPKSAAKKVYPVSYFFDNVGMLIAAGIVDENLVLGYIGESVTSCWSVLEPYILREREIRGGDFQVYFEHLAVKARKNPPSQIRRKYKLEKNS